MEQKVVWQQGSANAENLNNLATIREWWASLNGKEISWQQRIIPLSGEITELNWEPQRFDEVIMVFNLELRGITLYWEKLGDSQERNTTPHKLILDNLRQYLYIFPQSQKDVVICVGLPSIQYQTISITNPEYLYSKLGEDHILILKDIAQELEVKVTLSLDNFKQLIRELTK